MEKMYDAEILMKSLKKELAMHEGGVTRLDLEFLQRISRYIAPVSPQEIESQANYELLINLIALLAETGRRNLNVGRIIMNTMINILERENDAKHDES